MVTAVFGGFPCENSNATKLLRDRVEMRRTSTKIILFCLPEISKRVDEGNSPKHEPEGNVVSVAWPYYCFFSLSPILQRSLECLLNIHCECRLVGKFFFLRERW